MGVSLFEKARFEREPGCGEVFVCHCLPSRLSSSEQSRGDLCKGSCRPLCRPCLCLQLAGWWLWCRAIPTSEVLGTFSWSSRCLKAQAEWLPHSVPPPHASRNGVTSGCRVTARPNGAPTDARSPRAARRPAVPGDVMSRRKTWESSWVKAPAQAQGFVQPGEGASRVGELQGHGDPCWNRHLEKDMGTRREAKGVWPGKPHNKRQKGLSLADRRLKGNLSTCKSRRTFLPRWNRSCAVWRVNRPSWEHPRRVAAGDRALSGI